MGKSFHSGFDFYINVFVERWFGSFPQLIVLLLNKTHLLTKNFITGYFLIFYVISYLFHESCEIKGKIVISNLRQMFDYFYRESIIYLWVEEFLSLFRDLADLFLDV